MSSSDIRSGLNDLPDDFITISYEFTEEGQLQTDVSAWVKAGTQHAPSNDRSAVDQTFKLARSKRVNTLDHSIQSGFAQWHRTQHNLGKMLILLFPRNWRRS
ncbi:uncharacterized protein L199_000331 [Kwoniella botswanensis]|uniref:uncharacterized protein n=1 Tax=Kwoniella botswanensis TaxID=1268659 RepID=UPI00315C8944